MEPSLIFGPVSWILASPFLGAAILCFIPQSRPIWVRRIASCATLVPLALTFLCLSQYDLGRGGYQFVEKVAWVPSLGISYHVGVDGINLALVFLHALSAYTGVLISYAIPHRVKEYYIFYLLLIGGVFGVFTSLDLFSFYFFYEMAVIPMYPLIGIWGSPASERWSKEYAAMKLTLYLTTGAVVALIGLLALYFATGLRSFDLLELERHLKVSPLGVNVQRWIFPLLLFGFGVIAPMWPMHSWSPIGHAAAPSAVSMLHAGVLMKLGSYAIIRLAVGLMPEGARLWLPLVSVLCMMNVLYGGWVAMAQKDMKFIIGYSSSSHMGYVLLGIACLNSLALTGSVFLMVAHGLMTALAFALIGHVYDRAHTRIVDEVGGLAKVMPYIGTCFVIAAMASSSLPGFGNFIAEVLIIFGAWKPYPIQAILAVFGVVITATYMLRMVRKVFFGPLMGLGSDTLQRNTTGECLTPAVTPAMLTDASTLFDRFPYAILIASLVILGVWPQGLLRIIDSGSQALLARIGP